MEGLRDTLATDILVYTLETVQNIINAPGDNSIILKTMMLKHFCDNLEERIKQIDLVYCPSSNTFHGIIGVNANEASITINENHRYKHENVRETILNVGEEMGMIHPDLMSWMKASIEYGFGTFRQVYADYMMYKLYYSHVIYDLLLGFVFDSVGITLPFINPNDPDAYIFLSLNMNSWWDSIANHSAEKIKDELTGEIKIPWIKPTIAVKPNLSFKFSDINIIDMSPVFAPYDKE